jgi:hypothetical protein
MKDAFAEYTRTIEARASFYIHRAGGSVENHERNYPVAIALCDVVGDFTGEHRCDVYDRLLHKMNTEKDAA